MGPVLAAFSLPFQGVPSYRAGRLLVQLSGPPFDTGTTDYNNYDQDGLDCFGRNLKSDILENILFCQELKDHSSVTTCLSGSPLSLIQEFLTE